MNALPSKLLAVTDRHQAAMPLAERVARLLGAGLRWIWLRDRDLPAGERRALAETLLRAARAAGAALTIGADVDLALAVDADGVHLRSCADLAEARRRLGPETLIGVSAHGPGDIVAAQQAGADYATLSPIFSSPSKPGYGPALGLAALSEAKRLGPPILALGGVTSLTARVCLEAGASGLAVMGPIMRPDDELAAILGIIRRS